MKEAFAWKWNEDNSENDGQNKRKIFECYQTTENVMDKEVGSDEVIEK